MTNITAAMERIGEAVRPLIQVGQILVSRFFVPLTEHFDSSLTQNKFWALIPALETDLDKRIDGFGLRNALQGLVKARWGAQELWSIWDPDSGLHFKVASPETREKAAAVRNEFFHDLQAKQKTLRPPLQRKTPRSATRKRPTA
jgi:hypothetical protein